MWLEALGFMVMGLVSRLSLANHLTQNPSWWWMLKEACPCLWTACGNSLVPAWIPPSGRICVPNASLPVAVRGHDGYHLKFGISAFSWCFSPLAPCATSAHPWLLLIISGKCPFAFKGVIVSRVCWEGKGRQARLGQQVLGKNTAPSLLGEAFLSVPPTKQPGRSFPFCDFIFSSSVADLQCCA